MCIDSPLHGLLAGVDYDGATVQGIVGAGTTVTEVTVTIFDDDVEEMDGELFSLFLSLSNPPPGVILGESLEGIVNITDDDSKSVCILTTINTILRRKITGLLKIRILSKYSNF